MYSEINQNHPHIILVEPENAGNIGSVSRIMANMSFENLILINPVEYKNNESKKMALSHYDIIINAPTYNSLKEIYNNYDFLIAFSRRKGKYRSNYGYFHDLLRDLYSEFNINKGYKIGFVFGRESTGLKNQEVNLCSFTTEILTGKQDGSINISHCVGIACYEYLKFTKSYQNQNHLNNDEFLSLKRDYNDIWKRVDNLFEEISFYGIDSKENVKKSIMKILQKTLINNIDKEFIIKTIEKVRRLYIEKC